MVAVIHHSDSLHRAVNYNEQKLKEGKAEGLLAVNYPKDMEDLNFHEKYSRLKHQADLRPRTTVNSVHISLNFDPSEKLSKEQLQEIAQAYMQKIGFGEQPYLVYQHHDSGHPHLHVVTTPITKDGKRIELHNLGKNQSEKARKEIEKEFKLVIASSKDVKKPYELQPVQPGKANYGKSETKRAIGNVLNKVLNEYKFSSLPELNAILKQYNVIADRCSEDSETFKRGGLVYRILDENGNKIGVPIKASTFFTKPTLSNLELLFKEKDPLKKPHEQRLKSTIDWILAGKNAKTIDQFILALKKENVDVVLRRSKDGRIYGITYVDHKTKCVFNGGDLDKEYAAKRIQERCAHGKTIIDYTPPTKKRTATRKPDTVLKPPAHSSHFHVENPLKGLIEPEFTSNAMPFELKFTKKKKRKRRFL